MSALAWYWTKATPAQSQQTANPGSSTCPSSWHPLPLAHWPALVFSPVALHLSATLRSSLHSPVLFTLCQDVIHNLLQRIRSEYTSGQSFSFSLLIVSQDIAKSSVCNMGMPQSTRTRHKLRGKGSFIWGSSISLQHQLVCAAASHHSLPCPNRNYFIA